MWNSVSPGLGRQWQKDHDFVITLDGDEHEASHGYESLLAKHMYSFTQRMDSLDWNVACFFQCILLIEGVFFTMFYVNLT